MSMSQFREHRKFGIRDEETGVTKEVNSPCCLSLYTERSSEAPEVAIASRGPWHCRGASVITENSVADPTH
jgi:hypothetical protein